ncbi:MAG: C4-dicarboxylate ABC transporter substrate-binding protein [Verrucomicrobia bacterium]|nr:C4-dicarboxylate ABC transporter substrate-binding protein [Verrucomicrobiota bacterium]
MPASQLFAAESALHINLGTIAPRGASYHQSLLAMGEKWRRATDAKVKLKIFPDGNQGGEADMVRLMRIGTLDAGLLTAVGLGDIETGVAGLQSMPMTFRDLQEFDYVNEKLRPRLEKRLLEKGFVVLFWVDAGWVRYFSKKPMVRPDHLRKMKLFAWAGNEKQVDIMKKAGFHPVPLETAEIVTGLNTGLIDAFCVPPIFSLAGQLDLRAPHMLDLNWAPLVGAAVVRKETWDRIPATAKKSLLEAAAHAGEEIKAKSRRESDESVGAMKRRGLTVHPVTPEVAAEWRKVVEGVNHRIRGDIVPAEVFDEVQMLLKEYRAAKAEKST